MWSQLCVRFSLVLLLWLSFAALEVSADYFPVLSAASSWQAPLMQPWDPLRALATSITVAWTPAWNPWCAIDRYELQVRRPKGAPLRFADLEPLRYRESDPEELFWPADQEWTPWMVNYTGLSRMYIYRVPAQTAHAAQFRVRACAAAPQDGCSDYSPIQTAHTVLSAAVDKINFYIRGTGKNAPNYTEIVVNRVVIYRRRDETGLVMAVFSRLDFSLQWLQTYDTHRDRNAGLRMSKDIRRFNNTHFVFVASTISWEWHAPRSLVQQMERCGAYSFGQWAHIFAEQEHFASNFSDLQQTASQDEFGHPYAFVGVPGLGTGMGFEALTHNSGHYLVANLSQRAIIRGVAYYDYVARLYRIQDVKLTKADWYVKATPPSSPSLHNPVPTRKVSSASALIAGMAPIYTPYIGSLANRITQLVEANSTLPPYNFCFLLVTNAGVVKVDPRPRKYWVTELERIWGGASQRYDNTGRLLNIGITGDSRMCGDYVINDYREASPELCGPGGQACCSIIDAPNIAVTACGIGVSPTICGSNIVQMINRTNPKDPNSTKWPYQFRIIDWVA